MLKKIWRFIKIIVISFFVLSVVSVIIFRFAPVPVTILMLQRCVEQKVAGKPVRLYKQWVPLSKISNHLQLAVVTSEDQNFLWHHGFDFGAIEKAADYNEKQKNKRHPHLRGASTISQQCAKNVFLYPTRSFIRKGFEAYFTCLIELFWSKQRIMEVYLNVVELGNGIYGAEAASEYYFHKHANDITAPEAALLAATLPEPSKLNPGNPSAYLQSREAFILGQMEMWGGRLDYAMKSF